MEVENGVCFVDFVEGSKEKKRGDSWEVQLLVDAQSESVRVRQSVSVYLLGAVPSSGGLDVQQIQIEK